MRIRIPRPVVGLDTGRLVRLIDLSDAAPASDEELTTSDSESPLAVGWMLCGAAYQQEPDAGLD